MNKYRTAEDFGIPANVTAEVSALAEQITSLLILDDSTRNSAFVLFSNLSEETLGMIHVMLLGYDTESRKVASEAIRGEACDGLIHVMPKREGRALFVVAMSPVVAAFVRQPPMEYYGGTEGFQPSLEFVRATHLSHYRTRTMDQAIRLGREVNKVKGSDWIAYARGMAVMYHIERYALDREHHDYPFAMMLGENLSGAIACADKLMDLKGTEDSDAGYSKEIVEYLVTGGASALTSGVL